MTESEQKQARIQSLLAEHRLDALLLQRASSFAWATCGASSYINTASTFGEASLLITPAGRYVITNNIEATRLEKEEDLTARGWEFRTGDWYRANPAMAELTHGLKLGSDAPYPGAVDLALQVARLRAHLTPEEGDRLRVLGRLCGEAMDDAVHAVRPGMSEYAIAALLERATQERGVQPIVILIATDERLFRFRHPLPTGKTLDKYAMLILCGRKWGLVCSITRLVHYGRLPEEVRAKAQATACVDATFIHATRPGRALGEIFALAVESYEENGFAGEWQLHHQGGAAGYQPREFLATPGSTDRVVLGQAYAWNPSITGTKSEDTILVGEKTNEVLTTIPGWPMLSIPIDGEAIERPAILEV